MKILARLCAVLLFACTASLASVAAQAVSYQGLWYAAPAESEAGWGINFAHQGDVIFATWFTYDASGKAWWLTMTAVETTAGVFSGDLYKTTGAPFSAFVPPATVTKVGVGTITFTSATTGSFAYTVNGVTQTKPIVTQVFGVVPNCVWGAQADLTKATNFQDLWYASPAESEAGWGVNLTQQGTTIFATWFTYDANRNPLWLSATVPQTAANTFSGTLYLTSGPAFSAVPFSPAAVTLKAVGTVTFTFTDGNNGTFAYDVDLGDGVNKAKQSKPITRQVFRAPGTVCSAATVASPAQGLWSGTTANGQGLSIAVLPDGKFYIGFTGQGTATDAGVIHGNSTAIGGNFTAAGVAEYTLSNSTPLFVGGSTPINGTYVPRSQLQLNIGTTTVTSTYDASYDQPANVSSLVGTWRLYVGHITEQRLSTATINALGEIRITGLECDHLVFLTPRATENLFDAKVTTPRGSCYDGPAVVYFDSATQKLYLVAAFYNTLLGFPDLFHMIGRRQ